MKVYICIKKRATIPLAPCTPTTTPPPPPFQLQSAADTQTRHIDNLDNFLTLSKKKCSVTLISLFLMRQCLETIKLSFYITRLFPCVYYIAKKFNAKYRCSQIGLLNIIANGENKVRYIYINGEANGDEVPSSNRPIDNGTDLSTVSADPINEC
jgi:hypothetical protein